MPTVQQQKDIILARLSTLDLDKLEKLNTISESILSPMDTELTSVDFASMVDQVFKPGGLADRFFPEWTDRSSSDFGRFCVELFALFSDKDFFYQNHYSREGFVGVADQYKSIFHKAFHQGFNPPSLVSARGDIELLYSSGNAEFVPRGAVSIGISQIPELVYTNEAFTIPATTIDASITVPFIHGNVVQEDGRTFDGYSIFVDTKGISNGSMRLFIDGVEWEQVDNFLTGTPATKHFMVVHDEEGKAEILFAKDGLGARPAKGQTYFIEYIVGGGYIGDIGNNVLDLVINNSTNRNLISFTQFNMVGGNDLLPKEILRQTVVGKQRHQNRVVTPEDAEYFCKELTFVKKVKTEAFLGFLFIYVLTTDASPLSPSQRTLIMNKINSSNDDDRKLLLGYNMNALSPTFVPLKIEVDVYLSANTIKSSALIKAEQTMAEILDPLKNAEFGAGFNRSINASLMLQKITGSTNVVFTTVHRLGFPAPVNDIVFIRREITDYANSEITINIKGGI